MGFFKSALTYTICAVVLSPVSLLLGLLYSLISSILAKASVALYGDGTITAPVM